MNPFLLVVVFVFSLAGLSHAENFYQAQIGIKIQNATQPESPRKAKLFDRLTPQDSLQVYVVPDSSADIAFIYLIYSDPQRAQQVNPQPRLNRCKTPLKILPNRFEYMTFDGKNKREWLTVICSPDSLPEIETLDGTSAEWRTLKHQLQAENSLNLAETAVKPWSIGGVIRDPQDTFLEELDVYTGQSMVIVGYEFRVQ